MEEREWWYNEKITNPLIAITPIGFNHDVNFRGFFNFQKKILNQVHTIGLGNITKTRYDNFCHFEGIGADIAFIEVETILHGKFELEIERRTATSTIRNHDLIFNLKSGVGIYEHLPLTLNTDEAIEQAVLLIQKFINVYALPFFEYWSDIRCFLPFIETADGRRLNDYFSGYPTERKMIIWHLCNHPQSPQFTNEILKSWIAFSAENPSDAIFKRRLKNMKRVISELSKTEPIYEWDDKYLIAKPFQI